MLFYSLFCCCFLRRTTDIMEIYQESTFFVLLLHFSAVVIFCTAGYLRLPAGRGGETEVTEPAKECFTKREV